MNELQKVELDILKAFLSVCDSLGLTYYLVCGTALGAVKYNGFIPWDDDVDVALPREDYETFVKKAPALLPSHLFLQTTQSDPGCPRIYAKLRHSGTTYIEKACAHRDMHHGVYIDVFPLDGYPRSRVAQEWLELKKKLYLLKQTTLYHGDYSAKTRVLVKVLKALGTEKRMAKIERRFSKAISRYSTRESDVWCNHGNWQGRLEYAPRAQYGDGAWVEFEGVRVCVPADYDAYLTQKYGNWRAELPPEKQVGHHYYEVMDLHTPYTAYISKEKEG